MLDTATLRVAFGVVALAILVLFYVATYRPTHSAYSGWWCVSLVLFIAGASLYLFDGTSAQVVANPTGNALTTAGGLAVWAGTRALRGRPARRAVLVAGPVAVLAVSLADDPVEDVWTGGPFFLTAMAVALGAASRELRLLVREMGGRRAAEASVATAVVSMSVMAGLLAVFYLLRALALAVAGADHPLFDVVLGSQSTTLVTLVMLVVVTYTMSILGHQQQTDALRLRADRDALTGLLRRGSFFLRLTALLEEPDAASYAVLVGDLDGFKTLNDRDGHAAGDRALATFAAVLARALQEGDHAGRLGGDEFVVLLRDRSRAESFAAEVALALRDALAGDGDCDGPTVSFGIADAWTAADPDELVNRADVALYAAKTTGRDRAVRWTESLGGRPRAARLGRPIEPDR